MFSIIPCEFFEIAKRLLFVLILAYSNALLVNEFLLTVIGLNSLGISITAIFVAICSPILGALADSGGYRKLFFMFFSYLCIYLFVGIIIK